MIIIISYNNLYNMTYTICSIGSVIILFCTLYYCIAYNNTYMHSIVSNSLENPDTITQKGLKGIVPVAHLGLGIVSASSFHSRKPHNFWDKKKSIQKGLASEMGNNYP